MSLRDLTPAVRDASVTTHDFVTADGVTLALTRFLRAPSRDVVVLSHGMTGSTDMFVLGEHENLVSFLLDHGHTDVWSLDWRASGRWPYNRTNHGWVFDDVALFDMPAAFAELRRHVGDAAIHAVFHCASGLCLAMSMAAGLVEGLASATFGSVFLSTRVPEVARLKALYVPEVLTKLLHVSHVPSDFSEIGLLSRVGLMASLASLSRRRCESASCHLLNFLWGSDAETMFRHENIHPDTHRKLPQLFGPAPVSYYHQIRSLVWAEKAVRFKTADPTYASLPTDYLAAAGGIRTPLLLLGGEHCGLWLDSIELGYQALRREHPQVPATLEIVPGYGHNDIFLGRHAAYDVFPVVLGFLRQHSQRGPAAHDAEAHGVTPRDTVSRSGGDRSGGEAPVDSAITLIVLAAVAEALGVSPSAIDVQRPISAYGLDSVLLAGIAGRLEDDLERAVSVDLLFDLPSVQELSQRLLTVPLRPPAREKVG